MTEKCLRRLLSTFKTTWTDTTSDRVTKYISSDHTFHSVMDCARLATPVSHNRTVPELSTDTKPSFEVCDMAKTLSG